jgi:hypothetical protein
MRKLFNYEKKHEPVASSRVFLSRLSRNAVWALVVVAASLAIGSAGYMFFEGLSLIDAFTNAAMILSGMGEISPLNTVGGKIFASLYAVASGLLLFAIAGLMLAPVYHRILHRFHVEQDAKDAAPPKRRPRR